MGQQKYEGRVSLKVFLTNNGLLILYSPQFINGDTFWQFFVSQTDHELC
jgi:hypothetical protein